MSFTIHLITNTLATPDNLKRWGKWRVSDCPLCSNIGTLEHILNGCPVSLQQWRTTWRSNSILNHVTAATVQNKPDNLEIYSDLPDHCMDRSTIPQDILTVSGSGSKPDLVSINRSDRKIVTMELTSPLEGNIEAAYHRKMNKNTPLKLDLEEKGYSVS